MNGKLLALAGIASAFLWASTANSATITIGLQQAGVNGGAGAYYRNVNITTPDVGFTTICDPYWFYCAPAVVSVDQIVGERSSWDPGISVGGGVTMGLGESALFYVETRWHYIWGPEFIGTDGVERKANGQYFPVTFGFRF